MKILIMVHNLTGGGAERVAASWANGLSHLGNEVTVLADLTNQTYTLDKKVKTIQQKWPFPNENTFFYKSIRKILRPWVGFCQLWRYFRSYKPDAVVNVLYHSSTILLIARALSFRKVPIIMTDHNAYERPTGYKMKKKQWRNKFVDNRLFDCVTVLTNPDKEILRQHGINHVKVLHNPLFLNPVMKIPIKEKYVLAVGRIDDWEVKGFDILLKAWPNIVKNHSDWKLRIVGKGDTNTIEWLRSLSGSSSDSVEFKPYTTNIEEEYKQAAIYVLSSRYEGWGLVAVEAMSQGCATIACDYKGRQAEFIEDGVNGLLCEPDNVEQLAQCISKLIEDKDLRDRLQCKAITSVSEFNEEKVAKHLETIILDNLK